MPSRLAEWRGVGFEPGLEINVAAPHLAQKDVVHQARRLNDLGERLLVARRKRRGIGGDIGRCKARDHLLELRLVGHVGGLL